MSKTDPKMYRARYTKNGMVIDALSPARATETRPDGHSRPPHSSISSKSKSTQALMLKRARKGHEGDYMDLTAQLADMITKHAATQWKIPCDAGRADGLASAALWPYARGNDLTQVQICEAIGVNRTNFNKTWRVRLAEVRVWVRRWASEL